MKRSSLSLFKRKILFPSLAGARCPFQVSLSPLSAHSHPPILPAKETFLLAFQRSTPLTVGRRKAVRKRWRGKRSVFAIQFASGGREGACTRNGGGDCRFRIPPLPSLSPPPPSFTSTDTYQPQSILKFKLQCTVHCSVLYLSVDKITMSTILAPT